MSHPHSRAIRVGFTAVLLTTVLGSASGAPATGSAAPVVPVAQAGGPHAAADSMQPAAIRIPCISGSCELPLQPGTVVTPLRTQAPSEAVPAPSALAAR